MVRGLGRLATSTISAACSSQSVSCKFQCVLSVVQSGSLLGSVAQSRTRLPVLCFLGTESPEISRESLPTLDPSSDVVQQNIVHGKTWFRLLVKANRRPSGFRGFQTSTVIIITNTSAPRNKYIKVPCANLTIQKSFFGSPSVTSFDENIGFSPDHHEYTTSRPPCSEQVYSSERLSLSKTLLLDQDYSESDVKQKKALHIRETTQFVEQARIIVNTSAPLRP